MKRRLETPVLLGLLAALGVGATPVRATAAVVRSPAWGSLLARFATGGRVDYRGWKADAAALRDLDDYLASLAKARPEAEKDRGARLTFWINAYNACAIRHVLDRYPLKSVMDVKGFFTALTCQVAGESRPLDAIEKAVIRKRFDEPRVHFALNCASISCPPLQAKPWTTAGLDARLDRAARDFIRSGGARIDGGTLRLSRIFEWYAADFRKGAASVPAWVAKFLPGADGAGLKLAYDEYDWGLNGR